jgi:hypothetical protein
MKKNIVLIAGLIFLSVLDIYAQDFETWRKQANEDFRAFKEKSEQEFQDFRDKANAEYAGFMERSWEEFRVFQGIPAPESPDPVKPPVVEPDKKPTADPLPFSTVKPLPVPVPRPQPITPILMPEIPAPKPAKPVFPFLFYNTDCDVSLNNTLRFSLRDASEQSVAQAWKTLSGKQYDVLINDCLTLRERMNLSDWGYMQMLRTISEKFLDKASNEAVLLQMFVLTQSGYKVRISRTSTNRLALLIPFRETLCEYTYLSIDNMRYYIMDKELRGQAFYVCNLEFPKEQYFSWQTGQPDLMLKLTEPKTFTSGGYPEISVPVQTNQNLIDYYNSYPLVSDWNLYVLAGLSNTVKQTLYPPLQHAIANKSKTEAAGILLNFIQTSFAYQTDGQQFGYERPFFADEDFFYPYNDCEDRSILYAILVKELLGLEVVLLHYPDHLATAVHFPENIDGDYLVVNEQKFIVCDPTYIGAGIGMAMSAYKKTEAKVVTVW